MLVFSTLLTFIPLVVYATAPGPHCQVYNGRIIPDAEPSDWNDWDKKIPYDPDYNLGEGMLFPQIIRF